MKNKVPFNNINNYGVKSKQLGSGTYGIVNLYCAKNTEYAIKNIKKEFFPSGLREAALLSILNNKYIISLIDINVKDDLSIELIMENYGISVNDYKKTKILSLETKKKISLQLIDVVSYLHYKEILHGDINLKNLLISDEDGVKIKLIDFGLSRALLFSGCELTPDILYSIEYRPPEILLRNSYSLNADMWAVGCAIYSIYNKTELFNHITKETQELDLLYYQCRLLGTTKDVLEKYPDMYAYAYNADNKFVEDELINLILSKILVMDPVDRFDSFQVSNIIGIDNLEVMDTSKILNYYCSYPSKHNYKKDLNYLSMMMSIIHESNIELKTFFMISYIYDKCISKLYNKYNIENILSACIYVAESYIDYPIYELMSKSNEIVKEILVICQIDFVKTLSIDYLMSGNHNNITIIILKILSLSEYVFVKTPKELSLISLDLNYNYDSILYLFDMYKSVHNHDILTESRNMKI